jgi:hypothetical protein
MALSDLEEAVRLVNAHPQLTYARGEPQSVERIAEAEEALQVRLPPTCCRFLETFGYLSFGGIEFFGVAPHGAIDAYESFLVWGTLKDVNAGFLPRGMLRVSEDGMGSDFALDLRNVDAGDEGPVVYWHSGMSMPDDALEIMAEDFGAFLRQEVEQSIAIHSG